MKRHLVVAYDIADTKRRNKICATLEQYGQRVNYSVFECFLKEKEISEMKLRIEEQFKKGRDIILYYHLCKDCLEKVERKGHLSKEKQVVKTF